MVLKPAPGERGAALFIVVLVVTLLAAIGIFAARVTSLVGVAAGFSRRAASAFYLNQYALNVVAADVAAGKGTLYNALMSSGGNDCRANANAPLTTIVTCFALEYTSGITPIITSNASSDVTSDPQGLLGELVRPDNPGTTLAGSVRVEMTDLQQAPNARQGSPLSGGGIAHYWQALYSTTAVVEPVTVNGMCDIDATRASEVQTLRSYVQYVTIGQQTTVGH